MSKEEFERKHGAQMREFGAALKRHNEGPDIARLRDDLKFSADQGPNYLVMTTQEAVRAALAHVDSPNSVVSHTGALPDSKISNQVTRPGVGL